MSFDPALAFIHCAHCDCATPPEPQGQGLYFCSVCARVTDSGIRPSATAGSLAIPRRRKVAAVGSSMLEAR